MVSLGIGLTSNCNLHCAHCYRDQDRIYNLSLADVQKVCKNLEISSIGFGTGENGLNPEYFDIIEYLHNRGIKLTLASNGYTLSITSDDMLKYFGDVEFSIHVQVRHIGGLARTHGVRVGNGILFPGEAVG